MPRRSCRTNKLLVLCCLLGSVAAAETAQPVWQLNLQSYGLRPFLTQLSLTWTRQQNVIFLTPDRVALYQVEQLRKPAPLSKRNRTGGAGNFFIEFRVFDVHDGRLVKSFHGGTSAGFSKILPTDGGEFLVRTGDAVSLYSSDFRQVASKEFPLSNHAPIEGWQIGITPSGAQVVMLHQQIYPKPGLLGAVPDEKSTTEVEILDARTLSTLTSFSVRPLSSWSVADGALVAAGPAQTLAERRFGLLDFAGNWSALAVKGGHCNYQMEALDAQSFAARGCDKFLVVNFAGETLFSRKEGRGGFIGLAAKSGRFLALEIDRPALTELPGTNLKVSVSEPERLEIVDLAHHSRLPSIRVHSENVYYAISKKGDLAVVDGGVLALYHLEQ